MVQERFNNYDSFHLIKCPVLFIHGKKDTLIPKEHSEALFEKCNSPCQLVTPNTMDHCSINYQSHLVQPIKKFFYRCKSIITQFQYFEIPEYLLYFNNL